MRKFYLPMAIVMAVLTAQVANAGFQFSDVTETVNSPGDTGPLYGSPTAIGNQLNFNPAGFSATSAGGGADITDGQLNFTVSADMGDTVGSISIHEGGDYTLIGTGANTLINYSMSIVGVTVLDIDGLALATPVVLPGTNAFGSDLLSAGSESGTPWSLDIGFDVSAALANAGVAYVGGATKVAFAVNNTLAAISDPTAVAFIAKKDFVVNAEGGDPAPPAIPEPSSFLMIGLVLTGTLGWKRRRNQLFAEAAE